MEFGYISVFMSKEESMDIRDFSADMPYYRGKVVQDGSKGNGSEGKDALQKAQEEKNDWEEKMRKWDEQMQRIREENRREQERLQEEHLRKKRIQKKLQEKLALKQYLARQDEIHQMNEKVSMERAAGEDVYIEKPPLSKSLSAAEIAAICSKA